METHIQDDCELCDTLAQLERESTGIVSLLRAAQLLEGIAQRYRESGNIARAQELLWESEALMLGFGVQFQRAEAENYLAGRIKSIAGNPLWKSRLQRALVCLGADYARSMAYAESCEQVIAYFRRNDGPQDAVYVRNFAANAQKDWLEVVHCYQEALNIYLKHQKHDKVEALLTGLFHLVQTCDESTSGLALQLLLTLGGSVGRLEKITPGTRSQLKALLRSAINQKTREYEMDFWLLALIRKDEHRSALELLRDLAGDEEERRAVDKELCHTMELAAQMCLARGNIDGSEMWYRDAARIAQDRLKDTEWAGRLLEIAGTIPLIRAQRPPADLEMVVLRAAEEQHRERFLLLPEQFLAEYASVDDKLTGLLADDRLLLDKAAVEARAAQYRGKGILGWLSGRFTDARGNPRGDYPTEAPFLEQYVSEVARIVGTLFDAWQESGDLVEGQVIALLEQRTPGYDRAIFEVGLSHHFRSDYVSSIHVLVPRFEDYVTWCARAKQITTKRLKEGRSGEALLGDILRPDNAGMRSLLGEALLELAWWYMINSAGPFNWRNKVAHGWVCSTDCNIEVSAMIIYLTLRIAGKVEGRGGG